jgi:hypothetical protein
MAQHTLEPTSVSLTDTLVNRARNEDGRPSLISAFSGVTIISPSSEQPLVDVNQPHPEQSESLECGQATIPPSDPGRKRTLVLCFDGTGDQFDADNSNIVQLLSLLKKDDNSQQMVYYQVRGHNIGLLFMSVQQLLRIVRNRNLCSFSNPGLPHDKDRDGVLPFWVFQHDAFIPSVLQTFDLMFAWGMDSHIMST